MKKTKPKTKLNKKTRGNTQKKPKTRQKLTTSSRPLFTELPAGRSRLHWSDWNRAARALLRCRILGRIPAARARKTTGGACLVSDAPRSREGRKDTEPCSPRLPLLIAGNAPRRRWNHGRRSASAGSAATLGRAANSGTETINQSINQSSSKTKAIKFLTTSSSMESAVPTHHSWSTIIAGTARPRASDSEAGYQTHVYMQLRTIFKCHITHSEKSLFHYWEIGKVHIKAILNISSDCLKRNRNTSLPAARV